MPNSTQIESIEIRNYRCFRNIILGDLPRMTVIVGTNGSGKSTLFDVLTFLKDALAQNVATAVARRGGYHELVSRGQSGPIAITVKFRESGGRLATYRLELNSHIGGRVVVDSEVLSYRRGQYGRPWHFVDFRGGQVFVSTHSPDFLNGAELDEIFWLVKKDGFTSARRASGEGLLQNLIAEGDLPGALWRQGFFEGAGPG